MARTERIIEATPEQVFSVLADAWTYSDWVVGTAHVRDVDDSWPAPGSQLHHKAGPWPVSLRDSSTVESMVPNRELKIRAGLWPLGEADVRLQLEPVDENRTRVVIEETFRAGPLLFLRNKINDLVLHGRNTEALDRLADLAVARRAALTNF